MQNLFCEAGAVRVEASKDILCSKLETLIDRYGGVQCMHTGGQYIAARTTQLLEEAAMMMMIEPS